MIVITVDDVAAWYVAGGGYWWHDEAAGAFLVSEDYEPPVDGAVYLMSWQQPWFDQWNGDWQAAADQLNGIIQQQL